MWRIRQPCGTSFLPKRKICVRRWSLSVQKIGSLQLKRWNILGFQKTSKGVLLYSATCMSLLNSAIKWEWAGSKISLQQHPSWLAIKLPMPRLSLHFFRRLAIMATTKRPLSRPDCTTSTKLGVEMQSKLVCLVAWSCKNLHLRRKWQISRILIQILDWDCQFLVELEIRQSSYSRMLKQRSKTT